MIAPHFGRHSTDIYLQCYGDVLAWAAHLLVLRQHLTLGGVPALAGVEVQRCFCLYVRCWPRTTTRDPPASEALSNDHHELRRPVTEAPVEILIVAWAGHTHRQRCHHGHE